MARLTRRRLLELSALSGGIPLLGGPAVASTPGTTGPRSLGPVVLEPDDPRYAELTTRGYNARFTGSPDVVHLVGSAGQVVRAVEEAARTRGRVAVRSGGHCFENFVDDPAVRVPIDVSEMTAVTYDPDRRVFAVEAGATLGRVYRTLYLGWGVTVPGAGCPTAGVGGHVAGGGYGALSRRYGLVIDHLHGVEVMVTDRSGRARLVTATRDSTGAERELWWAHTGGGGGNSGVVTRYLFRTPGATGGPAPYARSPSATRRTGRSRWTPALDASRPRAAELLDALAAELTRAAGAPHTSSTATTPRLKSVLRGVQWPGGARFKSKSTLLRRPWDDRQIGVLHDHLNRGGPEFAAAVCLTFLGGRVNDVPAEATAMPHRDCLFSVVHEAIWGEEEQTERQLAWFRGLYRELHADTGRALEDPLPPQPGRAAAPGQRTLGPLDLFRYAPSARPPG
ncbi:FAD-binding protein [Streptomyces shenzhenensis]|uniref:FAD-binding oxidoreductase n=1 Tax=Streptomyces shenzhenensis TaxID=943815 RepID=UPI0033CF28E3